MDRETGLLQVHLLCSGSGANPAWQWRDTKSLPVEEAGRRPPIKTQRLWVTFHRAQLLRCNSMPTHYSWRVVCLVCVCVTQVKGCHCYNSVCVCVYCHTTWLFFYKSLFDYSYSYILHWRSIRIVHSYQHCWRCGKKMDTGQFYAGENESKHQNNKCV